MRFTGLKLKTPPAVEPLSLADAKAQIKVDSNYEDSLITAAIAAIRRDCENFLGRSLVTQTWTMTLDEFPDGSGGGRLVDSFAQHNLRAYKEYRIIEIPRPPLQSINFIKYIGRQDALDPTRDSAYDPATRLHTLDPQYYQVDAVSEPGRVAPITSIYWPFTDLNLLSPALNSVQIEFVSGYGTDADVALQLPNAIAAMKLFVGHLFENREAVITGLRAAAIEIPLGARDLLWPDRIVNFF
jgi:hypothetical protein